MKNFQQNQKNEIIRAFIAICFPEKVILHLRKLQTLLKSYKIRASWPNPSNMHLTLKFLGDIPSSRIQVINTCINRTVLDFKKESERLSLSVKKIGVFPTAKKPRVIWTGIQGQTSRLEMIHSLLDANLGEKGFKKEKKAFSPHITLCRLKQSVSEKRITQILQNHADIESEAFFIKEITLFKSQLTSSGAVHTKLFSAKI
ncbi:MAG: RNA 2',3'-cyclic phosphodiesterase [Desulfobacteraceae bacterium]|nr:RNA 2',3'-cyclic phosphodiesterase [Desulfobacteraceae bacterium]